MARVPDPIESGSAGTDPAQPGAVGSHAMGEGAHLHGPESSGAEQSDWAAHGAGEWDSPAAMSDDRRLATDRVMPTRINPMLAQLSTSIGGPVGQHAAVGRNRAWTPLRILFLLALVTLAFGWFGKAGCIQQTPAANGSPGQMRLDWDDQRQFYGLCYSNVVAGYSQNRLTPDDLAAGAMPYRTFWTTNSAREYIGVPVVTAAFMYVSAQAARGWGALTDAVGAPSALAVVDYFNIAALLMALGWLIAVWATMRSRRRQPWMVAAMAVSPLVIVHAFTAFEVLPVMFVALAMLAWSRARRWLTGVFVGLGACTTFYPILLIPAIAILCVRYRQMRDAGAVTLAAIGTWVAVNLPVVIAYPSGWAATFTGWRDRMFEQDTVYRLIAQLTGWSPSTTLINALVIVLMVGVIAGVAYVGMRAERAPSLAALMFVLVAGFLVVGKEWRPESSLWLVPLAVLAIPHPRVLLAWMTFEALLWIPRMSLFLDPERRWLPEEWFYIGAVIRGLIVLGLVAFVVWDLLRPAGRRTSGSGLLLRSPSPVHQPVSPG